jgi:O-antigen/teichoic acid export membrane protein
MLLKLKMISERFSPGLRKILGNIGWLFAERILSMIVAFFVGIYVIRYLGSEDFGKLNYAVSFVAIFGIVSQLGLNKVVIRNIIQEEKQTPEILGTAFVLKLVASLMTIVLTNIFNWKFNNQIEIRSITFLLTLGLLLSAFDVIEFWFESQVLGGILAIVRSVQLILSSIIKLLLIALHLPLISFVWMLLAEQVIKVLGIIWNYLRQDQHIFKWSINWSKGKEMLWDSWPLILANVMVTIYMKIDQVMLGNMANTEAVGTYAAAIRFSEIWYFIPLGVCSSIFPSILRARQRSEDEYYARLQQLYDLMAWIALAIAIPMTFFSVPLMVTLLGKEFAESGHILAWHIWASPFVFLGVARTQWMMAENLTRLSFLTTMTGAVVNIGLNFLLIPAYEGVGAAIATAISYAIVSHISCMFYRPMFNTGLMLTKALFIPFRFKQNLIYLNRFIKILS